mmetsp:Transcript_112738/g.313686  ORF Transcript_112738/g.313686 Transcript_112738/m.313686 type:complete len:424 (+) Transcript_112738:67-1338(+)
MAKLRVVIGNDKYPLLEVPADCTVGLWKELLAQGLLGPKILYAEKLLCRGEECRTLTDTTPLPSPPSQLHVAGPRSIVGMFEIALKKKVGLPTSLVVPPRAMQEPKKKPSWPWVDRYHVLRTIGSGFMGPCVYEAKDSLDGKKVALKWPAKSEEIEVLKSIAEQRPSGVLGIPQLRASGRYENRRYLVMEMLRLPLQEFFPRIWSQRREHRWPATCILGRLLLRRLEALHRCGFVHCDVSPENVLLGRSGSDGLEPHLVDFGLARPYPGGAPLAGEHGSGEWSSIRSGDGGERRPEDDLEALGWVLANCMHSVLPWFGCLENAYNKWHIPATREAAVRQVQFMKRKFLTGGWKAVGQWCADQPELPPELHQFILACQKDAELPGQPDYQNLMRLLGAHMDLDAETAEEEDLRMWHREFVRPLS